MPASNALPRDPDSSPSPDNLLWEVYGRTFGVAAGDLDNLYVTEKAGEIWAAAARPPARLRTRRPAGLRALRLMPDGPKPTSTFLSCLGHRVRTGRVDVDLGSLRALLLGRRIPVDRPDAYVALVYEGLVLGCARVERSLLRTLLPTGRRRELLEILPDRPPLENPKL